MNLLSWLARNEPGTSPVNFVLPLELEDSHPLGVQRSVLRTGSLILVAVAIWAGLTPIRELAVAPGIIQPKGDIRSVQHLEGGIVAEIFHHAGDVVHAGDPIIRFAPDQTGNDLGQLQERLESLQQHRRQLEQLIASQKDHRSSLPDDAGTLGAIQKAVLETRIDQRNSEHLTLDSRISQRKTEIANAEREIVALKRMVEIKTQVFEDRSELLKQGLATRRSFFDDQSSLEQAKTQLLIANGRLATAREALNEAQSAFTSSDAEAMRDWSEELSKIAAEIGETEKALAKQQDRFERLVVRAPVDGVIQTLTTKSIGEVIGAGDTFAKIVPLGVPLFAEVQVKPDDIGHVRVGDPAELKVTAFDSAIYGKLKGRIDSISPSSFQRENGDYFFKASVVITEQNLLGQPTVAPGMIVSAEIITGAKSFLRYILKPIFKVFGPAFSER
jgi:membrane fusion protein, adhesin transport system